MRTYVLLALCLRKTFAESSICMRVVGGTETTIEQYPTTTAILRSNMISMEQICGGAIINERFVLTAAHCFLPFIFTVNPKKYGARVGSSYAHSGGIVHKINGIVIHHKFSIRTMDSDVALMRTASNIGYSAAVKPAMLASTDYKLRDNEPVWAIGWGTTSEFGQVSEKLRHVQVWSVNHYKCRTKYKYFFNVTNNMMCAGWLDVGGRDQCTRDSGSPVYHNGVIVGTSSMGIGCGRPCFPGINVRISSFSAWITSKTSIGKPKLKPKAIEFSLSASFGL